MAASSLGLKHRYSEGIARWLYEGSHSHRMIAAGFFAGAIFLANQLFHFLLEHDSFSPRHMAADLLSGTVIGWMAMRLLEAEYRRRQELMARLRDIGELNHEVRNSLEVISMSAYSTRDRELFNNIQTAVERIQRALRDILGPGPARKPPGRQWPSLPRHRRRA